MGELEQLLLAHIDRHGPIGFDEYQANALYAPDLGFYTGGGGAGRRRDFLTSPEVGPLFGAVVARALDTWWEAWDRPSHLAVVEAGAGPGTLARAVLAARPACIDALHLTLVEPGTVQWADHPAGATSRTDLPEPGDVGPGPVVVLANELLDNLPTQLAERTPDGWAEVVVTSRDGCLAFDHRPLDTPRQDWCAHMAGDAAVGSRIPVQVDAAAWLGDALHVAGDRGRVVAFDYARTTATLAALDQDAWLRTYAAHGRGGPVLDAPGTVDITCDVAIDQLALVAAPTRVRTQADFLAAHGIDELVAEGRRRWERLGYGGGVEALAARSRAGEARALTDPTGLGGFTVLEWERDGRPLATVGP